MDITTVIINYQTPDLLEIAVRSFKKYYPNIPLLIIDNGSKDESADVIQQLQLQFSHINCHFLEKNIYHGPAMNLAAKKLVKSELIFFLDSDTETKKGGFLQEMHSQLTSQKVYGVGEIISVNKRGFKDDNGQEILLTPYMLIKKDIYLKLSPFLHHGQPTIKNFSEAHHQGYVLRHFPISEYILHHWRGTANRFGYGLGLKGKLNFVLNKLGI